MSINGKEPKTSLAPVISGEIVFAGTLTEDAVRRNIDAAIDDLFTNKFMMIDL